jgi:hypothetical protein
MLASQRPQRPQRDEAALIGLLVEVNLARAQVRESRGAAATPANRLDQQDRHTRLADAMEAYADVAAASGVPLPYRYRDEMRLYRALTRLFQSGRAS